MSRRRKIALVAALLLVLIWDFSRPPDRQLTARGLLGAIHLYQATLSPRMPALGVRCRFTPTCSHYGEGAIRKYGALGGTWRTVWRVMRCGPWTPQGTIDYP
jgi:putative membrane protein insertion efficiency factor